MLITKWQSIFLLSTVNNQPNFQELLPVTGREWPKGTWLTRRREELKEQQAEQEDEQG